MPSFTSSHALLIGVGAYPPEQVTLLHDQDASRDGVFRSRMFILGHIGVYYSHYFHPQGRMGNRDWLHILNLPRGWVSASVAT